MTNLNFRQIEVFVAVADCRSFSDAANRLYLAQSTVSSHIQALENTLHIKLFDREAKKSIALTPDGQRVYLYAKEILEKCRLLEENVIKEVNRNIRIGASTAPAQGILPQLLHDYSLKAPAACCEVKIGNSAEIQQMLLNGDIQLGFTGNSDNRQALQYEKIAEDHLVMVTANTPYYARLKNEGALGIELLKEPLVMRESGSATQMRVDNYLSERSIPPEMIRVAARVSMPEMLRSLILNGTGVSIMSEMAVEEDLNAGKLLAFPLEDKPVSRNIYMVYCRNTPLSTACTEFIDFVREKFSLPVISKK